MNLEDVYAKQVGKSSVGGLSFGKSFPSIERDPNLMQLERDVMSQLAGLMPKEEPNIRSSPSVGVRTVSYEEALKELLELEKASKIGS